MDPIAQDSVRGRENMIRFRHAALVSSVVLAAALAAVPPAAAQNINAVPNYGTVTLRSGFTPDPHVTRLRSGGNVDASGVSSDCRTTSKEKSFCG